MKLTSQKLRMNLAVSAAALFVSAAASAQPIHRTYVSTTGDDQHTFCTIWTPCRTFKFAMKNISNNSLGNEVIALTGGDFGPISVDETSNITVDGGPGMATVSAPNGGTAVRISPLDKGAITLRNLRILGNPGYSQSPNSIGISYIPNSMENITHQYGSTQLVLDHVVIENFNTGISVKQHSTHRLAIADVTINECNSGIYVHSDSGLIQTSIQRAHINNTQLGIMAGNKARIAVWDSGFAFSMENYGSLGFMVTDDGDGTEMAIDSTLITGVMGTALYASGAHSWLHVGSSVIMNSAKVMASDGGAQFFTFGNNRLTGNQNDGSATVTTPLK